MICLIATCCLDHVGGTTRAERDKAESSDEMLTAQGTLRIQREVCLMCIGRISDGGTHIFSKEEHHYLGPVISCAEWLRIAASAKRKSFEMR